VLHERWVAPLHSVSDRDLDAGRVLSSQGEAYVLSIDRQVLYRITPSSVDSITLTSSILASHLMDLTQVQR
jgi:hypothetical protein